VAPAWAQPLAPSGSASAAEAAMARARRQAANPLRVILDASKSRRPPGQADAAELVSPRSVNTRQPVVEATPVETLFTLNSSGPAGCAQAVPTLAIEPVPGVRPSNLACACLCPRHRLAAMAASATPRLLTMVEPVLTARAIEEAGGLRELPVDLVIRADGSVAEVRVALKVPRPLARAVETALEQWRFEPLPGERLHRVQLAFDPASR
jgi:hypothetical protein